MALQQSRYPFTTEFGFVLKVGEIKHLPMCFTLFIPLDCAHDLQQLGAYVSEARRMEVRNTDMFELRHCQAGDAQDEGSGTRPVRKFLRVALRGLGKVGYKEALA